MTQAALDKLGRLLMSKVRDEAISDWRMILNGQMKGEQAERVRQMLVSFDPGTKATLTALIPQVVDTVLHHLLWTLEQTEDVSVGVRTTDGFVPSLRDASDGLAGELYSDAGWIARFSREKSGNSGVTS